MEEKIFEGMPYLVTYPEGFQEGKKYPLVIFLHGAGTRGDSIEKLKGNKAYLQIKAWQDSKGFILLAPHCKKGDWNEWMNLLIRLVGEVRELPYIDETHIHLTGNSMGGYGTWAFSILRPIGWLRLCPFAAVASPALPSILWMFPFAPSTAFAM